MEVDMSVGKTFEGQVLKAFQCIPGVWAARFTDAMIGKGHISVQSPPDLIVVGDLCLLIECKVVKGRSLPFSRVSEHQLEALEKVNRTKVGRGMLAIQFYNGLRGKAGWKCAFLVPVERYVDYLRTTTRKSMPVEVAESLGEAMEWHKGTWTLPPVFKAAVRP